MEKLFAGTYGVFLESSDSDFEEFIDTIMHVLTGNTQKKKKSSLSVILIILLVIIAVLAFLYLKLMH
ncbi:L1 entry protein complex L1 and I2 [Finch poxvirus]|uniref:L1 entry protein complex L1 and I2 protein n=1 Tax=Condorpox virus TaxID=3049970 RepID=A0AAT9UPM0_9POXV|nr:L1 entry protein complex L1 and I2 [Finch poxvirus]UOX38994.1 L1 entry protein complex L1 and I2 [Finch poxvirus]